MKIIINNEELTLNKEDVKLCRDQLNKLFKSVEKTALDNNDLTYYFTFLIMAHVMSQNCISQYDPKVLKIIMDDLNNPAKETESFFEE